MSSVLGQRISYRSSAALLAVSVGVAYLSAKVTISPLTLLLLSPIGLIGSAVVFVGLDLWLSWAVERQVAARQVSGRASPTIWNNQSTTTTSKSIRNQSRTVPPLIFTSPAAWSVTQTRAAWEANLSAASPSQWPGATEALSNQLNSLLALISRDFVQSWYSRISNSPAFPAAVDSTIQSALIAVATRAGAVDWSTVLVNRLLPLITDHFSAFRTAELALRGQDLKIPLTESAELDLFLAKRYAAESSRGKLHPAVDVASPNSRPAEETWLSNLFGVVVPLILPEKEGESAAVRIMVREIVACAVMVPVVETLSDPDFYNRIIDDKAGAAIRDQKMVTQFREALDKQGDNLTGMSPAGRQGTIRRARTLSRPTEEISVRTTPRQFDAFLRGIDKCKNLLDAKRLRSDVAGQIRKAKAAVGDRAGEEVVDGVKVSVLTSHIERLYGAKTRADERIARLGGVQSKSVSSSPAAPIMVRFCLADDLRSGPCCAAHVGRWRTGTRSPASQPARDSSPAELTLLLYGVPRASQALAPGSILVFGRRTEGPTRRWQFRWRPDDSDSRAHTGGNRDIQIRPVSALGRLLFNQYTRSQLEAPARGEGFRGRVQRAGWNTHPTADGRDGCSTAGSQAGCVCGSG